MNKEKGPLDELFVHRDDEELVRRFQEGKKECFNELVRKYQDRVFNLSYRFMGEYREAEDMAQDVFLTVYRSLDTFRFGSSFSTWLYHISANRCRNRLKSWDYRLFKMVFSTRKEEAGYEALYGRKLNPLDTIADESPSPAQEMERKDRERAIQLAINTLSADYKTVVLLRDIEGCTYDEISAITGLPVGTVKSRLFRARLALKEHLRDVR